MPTSSLQVDSQSLKSFEEWNFLEWKFLTIAFVIEGYRTRTEKSYMESFPSINLQWVAGWEYACLSQKTT